MCNLLSDLLGSSQSNLLLLLLPHVERGNDFRGVRIAPNHSVNSKVGSHEDTRCLRPACNSMSVVHTHQHPRPAHYDNSLALKWERAAGAQRLKLSVRLSAVWDKFFWSSVKHQGIRDQWVKWWHSFWAFCLGCFFLFLTCIWTSSFENASWFL